MNLFGAFTFGSLIKTFIPGFVWLVALLLVWHALARLVPGLPEPPLPDNAPGQQNALVLAVPLAILLGLLSNVAIFMGLNDALVRQPVRTAQPTLFHLHDALVTATREASWRLLDSADDTLRAEFMAHADAELLMLGHVELEQLAFVREGYWYHMEFQTNLLAAVVTMLVATLTLVAPFTTAKADWLAAAPSLVVAVVGLGGTAWFLLRSARKNYARHVAKIASLLAHSLAAEKRAAAKAAAA